MYLALQTVNAPARAFSCGTIVRRDGGVTFRFEGFDSRLDGGLVDAHDVVMLVNVDVQRLANRHHQMFFIQLGVTLDCFVLDVFRDVAQLGQCFVF